jgi:hypothetical protein
VVSFLVPKLWLGTYFRETLFFLHAKQSFAKVRSQTEFGNEVAREFGNEVVKDFGNEAMADQRPGWELATNRGQLTSDKSC